MYIVNYKLLKKCPIDVWNQFIKCDNKNLDYDDLIENNEYVSDSEEFLKIKWFLNNYWLFI